MTIAASPTLLDEIPQGTRHLAAVIGQPVAHSLSPVLHRAAYVNLGLADWFYGRCEVEPAALEAMLAELRAPAAEGPAWAGLSVTMPHKQHMLPMLDVVDPLAQVVGAANTVIAQRSGQGRALLAGFNTDVAGIVGAMRECPLPQAPRHAVILGSGATACSSLAALTELGATDITVAARNHAGPGRAAVAAHRMGLDIQTLTWKPTDPASNAAIAQALAGADLAVSTLPKGAADPIAAALPAALAGSGRPGGVLLDVVYDPWPTALAAAWSEAGGHIAPGWLMLLHQAVDQVRLMTGHTPELAPMREALTTALATR